MKGMDLLLGSIHDHPSRVGLFRRHVAHLETLGASPELLWSVVLMDELFAEERAWLMRAVVWS